MKLNITFSGLILTALVVANLTACNRNTPVTQPQNPIIRGVETRQVATAGAADARLQQLKHGRTKAGLSAAFATPTSPILSSKVTFTKSEILNRVFLYGTDLQYSSIGEEDGMLLQSLAIGHVTARFQILGSRLQLFAEEKYRFESNINIPLRLLAEWPIVFDNGSDITVDIATASPALAGVLGADAPLRSSWVRSVEFVPQGNYLLLETSIEMADGTVAEFMESLFPRETLTAGAPEALLDDPSREIKANRYGFLSNPVWLDLPEGRVQTATAQRFPRPEDGQTIDWYVTGNIPAEYVPAVRDGIEAWNRYSQKMWNRDFMRFKGILPAGVKIGDPRYNVINWDSVVDAGSAYESQASDPDTGLQSHSLIYLPYSWIETGKDFWQKGELSQDRTASLKKALDKVRFLDRKVNINCFNEGEMNLSLQMRETPEAFAKELLKGVLFHEVGHALGLAHNFKGSLSYDPDVAGSLFSNSIMDYNQYQIEHGAFDQPGSSAGPLLEYDRQILSVLYNDSADIHPTDVIVPHCDDSSADSKKGGVDPFCIRYDAGQDPTVQLVRTYALIADPAASLGKTKSLSNAVEATLAALPDPATVTDLETVIVAESDLLTSISAITQFYISAGAQGLNYMLTANIRMLQTYRAGTLPMTVDPVVTRQRVAGVVDQVLTMDQLPAATRKSYERVADLAAQWLRATPWYTGAAANVQTEREASIRDQVTEWLSEYEKTTLPRLRSRMLGAMARSTDAPFYLNAQTDYEAQTMLWFDKVLTQTTPNGRPYTVTERRAVATALESFSGVDGVYELKTKARGLVEAEIKAATTAEQRESLRTLRNML
jgi:hypothetical protein